MLPGNGRPKISFSKVAAHKIDKNFESSNPCGHDNPEHKLTHPVFWQCAYTWVKCENMHHITDELVWWPTDMNSEN